MIRRSKYGNRKVTAFGKVFDSILEHDRYLILRAREARGEISKLETQVRIPLKVNGFLICHYVADAVYTTPTGNVVEDCKSAPTMTPTFRLKAKLFEAIHGHKINIVTKANLNS
ncbi:MAG: DUF1064 domain-containing protein [Planctomycetes bacterium]|nr:DUF1064 domain-containing protein [Planctomycetota bacterium]